MNLLVSAATTEQRGLCRIKAIQAMGTFKDVRVVKGLEEAYNRASSYPFPRETKAIIKLEALQALGETHSPAAIDFLVTILNQPQVAEKADFHEKQQVNDERIAAARGLGHFKGGKPAAALVVALQQQQDIALRDRIQQSLAASTGQDFGNDISLWSAFVQKEGKALPDGIVEEKTVGDKIVDTINPVSWWK